MRVADEEERGLNRSLPATKPRLMSRPQGKPPIIRFLQSVILPVPHRSTGSYTYEVVGGVLASSVDRVRGAVCGAIKLVFVPHSKQPKLPFEMSVHASKKLC